MIKLPAERRTGRAKRGGRSPQCLARYRGLGVQLGDTHTHRAHTVSQGPLLPCLSGSHNNPPFSQLSPIRDLGFKPWPFPEAARPFPEPFRPFWGQVQLRVLGFTSALVPITAWPAWFLPQAGHPEIPSTWFSFLGCGGGSPPILDPHIHLTVLPTSILLPTCSSFPSKRGQGPGKGVA